jgi:hypothetical protein
MGQMNEQSNAERLGNQRDPGDETNNVKKADESPAAPQQPATTTPANQQRRTGPDTGRSRGSDLPSAPGTTERDTTGAQGSGGVEGTPGRDVDATPRVTDEDAPAGPRERE